MLHAIRRWGSRVLQTLDPEDLEQRCFYDDKILCFPASEWQAKSMRYCCRRQKFSICLHDCRLPDFCLSHAFLDSFSASRYDISSDRLSAAQRYASNKDRRKRQSRFRKESRDLSAEQLRETAAGRHRLTCVSILFELDIASETSIALTHDSALPWQCLFT